MPNCVNIQQCLLAYELFPLASLAVTSTPIWNTTKLSCLPVPLRITAQNFTTHCQCYLWQIKKPYTYESRQNLYPFTILYWNFKKSCWLQPLQNRFTCHVSCSKTTNQAVTATLTCCPLVPLNLSTCPVLSPTLKSSCTDRTTPETFLSISALLLILYSSSSSSSQSPFNLVYVQQHALKRKSSLFRLSSTLQSPPIVILSLSYTRSPATHQVHSLFKRPPTGHAHGTNQSTNRKHAYIIRGVE